jgi:hypothetical protein
MSSSYIPPDLSKSEDPLMFDLICSLFEQSTSISFLTSPVPIWYNDLLQCCVIKEPSGYCCYLEIKDSRLAIELQILNHDYNSETGGLDSCDSSDHSEHAFNKDSELYEDKNLREDRLIKLDGDLNMPHLSRKWSLLAQQKAIKQLLSNKNILLMRASNVKYFSTKYEVSLPSSKNYLLATIEPTSKKIYKILSNNSEIGTIRYNNECGPRKLNINYESDNYINMDPIWSETVNGYVLDFHKNRVREQSVKNLRIVQKETPIEFQRQKTICQFGRGSKLDRNYFVLDFRYPMSPLQAFLIALSLIDCS